MYALIKDNQIQVGPRSWLYSEFKEYLDENNLDSSTISRIAPTTPIHTPEYKILPVTIQELSFDSTYEQPVGPFLAILNESVSGYYEKTDRPLDQIKQTLKAKVADARYKQEIAGTTVTIQGTEVKVYTDREDRKTYLDAFLLAQENTVYNFKFPLSGNIFLPVTKSDLQLIVASVANHVQAAFTWEAEKTAEIDSKTTIEELKTVVLTYPEAV